MNSSALLLVRFVACRVSLAIFSRQGTFICISAPPTRRLDIGRALYFLRTKRRMHRSGHVGEIVRMDRWADGGRPSGSLSVGSYEFSCRSVGFRSDPVSSHPPSPGPALFRPPGMESHRVLRAVRSVRPRCRLLVAVRCERGKSQLRAGGRVSRHTHARARWGEQWIGPTRPLAATAGRGGGGVGTAVEGSGERERGARNEFYVFCFLGITLTIGWYPHQRMANAVVGSGVFTEGLRSAPISISGLGID